MKEINSKRLIAGGLIAGVLVNVLHGVGELATSAEVQQMLATLGLAEPAAPALAGLAGAGFVLGFAGVWLYAVLRDRYGTGPGTALRAGAAVWLLACALPNISLLVFGMMSARQFWLFAGIDLAAITTATLAGAWLYRDATALRERPGATLAHAGRGR